MNNIFCEAPEQAEQPAQRERFEPGWYTNLANDRYHGSAGTSSTRLKTLIEKTPAHYLHSAENPAEGSAATELGTAFHTLTLEPENFDDEVFVLPELNLRTKAGREERDSIIEEHAGKAIITREQFDKAKAMADAVRSHPTASILLEDIIAESSIYWWYKSTDPDDGEDYKQMAKVRPDALNPAHSLVIDLKSAIDPTYSGFQKAILNHYYHLSAAMYLEGVNQCRELLKATGCHAYTKFIWIVCESAEPYTVAIYEADPEFLEIGRSLFRNAMYKLHRAKSENFPGLPDEVRIMEPPTWARRLKIV